VSGPPSLRERMEAKRPAPTASPGAPPRERRTARPARRGARAPRSGPPSRPCARGMPAIRRNTGGRKCGIFFSDERAKAFATLSELLSALFFLLRAHSRTHRNLPAEMRLTLATAALAAVAAASAALVPGLPAPSTIAAAGKAAFTAFLASSPAPTDADWTRGTFWGGVSKGGRVMGALLREVEAPAPKS
jgi:hypothetical protein